MGVAPGAVKCRRKKEHEEDGECKVAAKPVFRDAEYHADDQGLGDGGVDEGVPECRQ